MCLEDFYNSEISNLEHDQELAVSTIMNFLTNKCCPLYWNLKEMMSKSHTISLLVHPDKTNNEKLSRWMPLVAEVRKCLRALTQLTESSELLLLSNRYIYLKLGCCDFHLMSKIGNSYTQYARMLTYSLRRFKLHETRKLECLKVQSMDTFRDFIIRILVVRKPKKEIHYESSIEIDAFGFLPIVFFNASGLILELLHVTVDYFPNADQKILSKSILQILHNRSFFTKSLELENRRQYADKMFINVMGLILKNPNFVRTNDISETVNRLQLWRDKKKQLPEKEEPQTRYYSKLVDLNAIRCKKAKI